MVILVLFFVKKSPQFSMIARNIKIGERFYYYYFFTFVCISVSGTQPLDLNWDEAFKSMWEQFSGDQFEMLFRRYYEYEKKIVEKNFQEKKIFQKGWKNANLLYL